MLVIWLATWTKEKTLFQKMTYFSTFCTFYLGAFWFDVPFLATVKAFIILGAIYKGQLISECLFDMLNFPKNQRKIWQISALESKKWSNHKIKAPYSVFITLNSPYNHNIIRKCLYFVDLTTFKFLGQKFVKFFVGFLENLRHQKDILKLTDL